MKVLTNRWPILGALIKIVESASEARCRAFTLQLVRLGSIPDMERAFVGDSGEPTGTWIPPDAEDWPIGIEDQSALAGRDAPNPRIHLSAGGRQSLAVRRPIQ